MQSILLLRSFSQCLYSLTYTLSLHKQHRAHGRKAGCSNKVQSFAEKGVNVPHPYSQDTSGMTADSDRPKCEQHLSQASLPRSL